MLIGVVLNVADATAVAIEGRMSVEGGKGILVHSPVDLSVRGRFEGVLKIDQYEFVKSEI